MIDPTYLATLRRQHRCELVITLVQLEQRCPGWWPDLTELAAELGADRGSLNESLMKLESLGLISRERISNTGGNWVWWVSRYDGDKPNPDDAPGWRLRDIKTRLYHHVPIRTRWQWAADRGITKPAMSSFLNGHIRTLAGRWQVVASPWDLEQEEEAA